MSDDRSKPYNLRSKRISGGTSEGFIRASELIRRNEERSGVVHEDTQVEPQGATSSQELVPDVPSNDDDQGGSERSDQETPQVAAVGDQGLHDIAGDPQGSTQASSHSPVAQQDPVDNGQEVLRLRVQVRNTRHTKWSISGYQLIC